MPGIKIEKVVMDLLELHKNNGQLIIIYSSDNEPAKGYVVKICQHGASRRVKVPLAQIEQVSGQPCGKGYKRNGKMGWVIVGKITKILEED